ncbi:MAG: thioesterase [Winogradskyella sp.]|nr:thioesterase [Winogradskyella sp.]|tara:strand:+ start:1412 stop:1867 length:456 start_codon:yes stop_codon:yes gene_type:complete
MNISPSKLNTFLMFKLPAAYFTGVRTKSLDDTTCVVTVKHRWINQNPFNSMFWAVQGMAAELTTGALVMTKIKASGKKISMLVANNNATFTKKATGRITFICKEGHKIDEAIRKAIETGEGQTVWLSANGVNKDGVEVSSFNFEWTLKVKS